MNWARSKRGLLVNSTVKGKFTKAQVKAAKEGVVVSERLKDRVKDVSEKGVDETILKFSKKEGITTI